MDLWPGRIDLARDLVRFGGAKGLPQVRVWYCDDKIAPRWFDPLIKTAEARGFPEITYRVLSEIYRRRLAQTGTASPGESGPQGDRDG